MAEGEMTAAPLIIDASKELTEFEIVLKVRGQQIDVKAPPGQPLDITWITLARAAKAYEYEMTAGKVIERLAQLSQMRMGGVR
jgi:hypothetical protein